MSMGIIDKKIASWQQLIAQMGNENQKTIHVGSFSFFPDKTLDVQGQILNPILT